MEARETKWFKTEKERLAYIRGQYQEYKLTPVNKKGKKSATKNVQTD